MINTTIFTIPNGCNCPNRYSRKYFFTKDFEYQQFLNNFRYTLCKNCETLKLDLIPDREKIKDIYPSNYGAYLVNNFGFIGSLARSIAAKIKLHRIKRHLTKPLRVLEFGCGSQPLVTLLDLNPKDIHLCDINISNHLKIHTWYEGNIESLVDTIGVTYDLIIFNQVLEHLSEPSFFIEKVYKLLNRGGLLYLETPNFNGYEAKLTLRYGVWGGFHAPRHFTIFNKKSISQLLIGAKFSILDIGSLLNPFLLNETFKNILELKKLPRVKNHFNLSNPFLLIAYIASDFFAKIIGLQTGNMYIICKRELSDDIKK